MENYNFSNNDKLKKWLALTIVIAAFSISLNVRTYIKPYIGTLLTKNNKSAEVSTLNLEDIVLPKNGVQLPISWGELGKRMVEEGVIDMNKLESLYSNRGGLPQEMREILENNQQDKIVINKNNSSYMLNLLWAFGLSNKTAVIDEGPLLDKRFGSPDRLASTAGWTMSRGAGMDHLSRHNFITLTKEQEDLVAKVAANIYRPCCDNPTIFPDCNHGMAMLGLLELLAYNGVTEKDMYQIALQVNSYWFPETYLTIAEYFKGQGVDWKDVVAEDVLSYAYSSNSGYADLLKTIEPADYSSPTSCGA